MGCSISKGLPGRSKGEGGKLQITRPEYPRRQTKSRTREGDPLFTACQGICHPQETPSSLFITCGLWGAEKAALHQPLPSNWEWSSILPTRSERKLHMSRNFHMIFPHMGGGYTMPVSIKPPTTHCSTGLTESLRPNGAVIIDATFRRKSDRVRFRALAEKLFRPFLHH